MKKSIFLKSAGLLCIFISILSCEDDDDVYYYFYSDGASGLLVNASPNSGDLYFYADENQVNTSGINYTDAFGYYKFYTGERAIKLQDANGNVLDSETISLADGDVFSAFAVNNFSNIELELYEDTITPPGAYRSDIRFINLSPDSNPITISLNSEQMVENLEFKEITDFMEVNDGSYDLSVYDSTTGELIFEHDNLDFYSGRVYTVFTKGYQNPESDSNDDMSIEKIQNF